MNIFRQFRTSSYIALLCLFIGSWTFFSLNTSSMSSYCTHLPIGCQAETVVFQPRDIRSDEWRVSIPYVLSQTHNDFAFSSNLVGLAQQSTLLGGGPTNHWTVLLKPFNVAYFFLSADHAMSLGNLLSILTLPLVIFFLLRSFGIARGYSFILSLSMLFTPFVQWWTLFPTIAFPLGLLLLVVLWIQRKKLTAWSFLVFLLAGMYCASITLANLYPPFQIPLLWLDFFLTVGVITSRFAAIKPKILIAAAGIIIYSLIVSGVVMYFYAQSFSIAFDAIQHSAYPGSRISTGGTFPSFRLLSGFYDLQLLNNAKPMGPYNQSEAAGFFNFFIFLVPVIIASEVYSRRKQHRNDWFIISLLAYIAFIGGWMFHGYPSWIGFVTLLERVPANRAQIGLGVAGFLLTAYYVYVYPLAIPAKWQKLYFSVIGISGFLTVLATGLYLTQTFPSYISSTSKIVGIAAISGSLIYASASQKKVLFAVGLLLFSLFTAGTVHPLRSGLAPITDSEFIRQVKEITAQKPGRWAVYNSNVLSPLLYANGIQTATGTYLYPQDSWWKIFDTSNHYQDIWNRYAHVDFVEPAVDQLGQPPVFILTNLDAFSVTIDPCDPVLSETNVLYLASTLPLTSTCAVEIPKSTYQHGIYIYRRVPRI